MVKIPNDPKAPLTAKSLFWMPSWVGAEVEVDRETGKAKPGAVAYVCATALVIQSGGTNRSVKIDPFTRISFTHATVNGRSLAAENPTRANWVVKGTTLVTASKLHSRSFTATFRHSQA